MQLDTFAATLKRRSETVGLNYAVRPSRDAADVISVLSQLAANCPSQIVAFYQFCDGFAVRDPHLDIVTVDSLGFEGDVIPFAIFDHRHRVAFDPSGDNVPDQWDIVNIDTGFCITRSFGSFITNKVWAWIDRNRQVWENELGTGYPAK